LALNALFASHQFIVFKSQDFLGMEKHEEEDNKMCEIELKLNFYMLADASIV